jgi:DNA-directed RNA polymerase subunit delta
MKRVIVDYAKLTNEILNLLVEKFPDGYDDSNIVRFRNAKNELIEAVEVRADDTIYLVKVSTKLADRIENYDEDEEIDDVIEPIIPMKSNGMDDDDMDDEDEDDDNNLDRPDLDEDDEDSHDSDYSEEEDDEEDKDLD